MKFRTDFVTNSSSSNYMTVTLNFTDSNSEEITAYEEGTGWSGYFKQAEDGLTFLGYSIKKIDELFACIYFYYNGDDMIEKNIIPILTSVFLFIAQKIDSGIMKEHIKNYKLEHNISLDWYPFDELENIISENINDEDQIRVTIENNFSCGSSDIIEAYLNLSENYENISDVDSVVFYDNCRDYGEFINHFSEDVHYNSYVDDHFPHIGKDDPLFDKEVNKWRDIFWERIYEVVPGKKEIEFDYDLDVEAGIESGDPDDCLADIDGANTYKWIRININNQIGKDERPVEEPNNEETIEHDIYFEIDNCLYEHRYYPPKYIIENIRNITEKTWFPRQFRKYPITDILEYINKYVCNKIYDCAQQAELELEKDDILDYIHKDSLESLYIMLESAYAKKDNKFNPSEFRSYYDNLCGFLDILPSKGIELDYADVAHYIFNENLENIYPLFKKGLKIVDDDFESLLNYASDLEKKEYAIWLETMRTNNMRL